MGNNTFYIQMIKSLFKTKENKAVLLLDFLAFFDKLTFQ